MNQNFQSPIGKISKISGKPISLIGDDIDTDRIIITVSKVCNFGSFGEVVFEDDRKNLREHPFDLACNKGSSILVKVISAAVPVENMPQALLRWGIKAIIEKVLQKFFIATVLRLEFHVLHCPKN